MSHSVCTALVKKAVKKTGDDYDENSIVVCTHIVPLFDSFCRTLNIRSINSNFNLLFIGNSVYVGIYAISRSSMYAKQRVEFLFRVVCVLCIVAVVVVAVAVVVCTKGL